MKIRKIVNLLGLMTLFHASLLFADDYKIKDEQIKTIITAWMKKNNIPGLAVEVYAMGVPHSYYFGLADKEKKVPVTNKTVFELGSSTALFTNILLAEEIALGRMSLNDSLEKYILDLVISSDYISNISLLNLATQTSSLSFDATNEMTSRSQLPEYFSNWIPGTSVGSTWTYSNMNAGLLGYALEASTHENINQLFKNRLLRPLGMQLIGTEISKEYEENYAEGYTEEDKKIRSSANSLFPSADGMKVSGDDMLQFLKASLQLPGVPEKIIDAMRMTQTAYVKTDKLWQGLGWTIHPINDNNITESMNLNLQDLTKAKILDKNNRKFNLNVWVDKTGETEGFSSYIVAIPAHKSGVVLLANRYISENEMMQIGREILFNLTNKGDTNVKSPWNIHL